jgi:ParB family transcriptional regulator, chromosome partitioning protein
MRRVSIEQLAENTVQRTLLRGLNVRMRPACSGCRPAAGVIVHRSFWSIPCVVRDGGIAEDDSLAENRERGLSHIRRSEGPACSAGRHFCW